MSYQLSMPPSEIEKYGKMLSGTFGKMAAPIQNAMATRYRRIVLANFGSTGIDRPRQWPLLSPAYSRRVQRKYATLHVTGRLKQAVKQEKSSGTNPARVFATNADAPYATAHQFGSPKNHLPARPFFPMKPDGSCTPFTFGEVMKVAEKETKNRL